MEEVKPLETPVIILFRYDCQIDLNIFEYIIFNSLLLLIMNREINYSCFTKEVPKSDINIGLNCDDKFSIDTCLWPTTSSEKTLVPNILQICSVFFRISKKNIEDMFPRHRIHDKIHGEFKSSTTQ